MADGAAQVSSMRRLLAQLRGAAQGGAPSRLLLLFLFAVLKAITTCNGVLQKRLVSSEVDRTLVLCFYRSLLAVPLLFLAARWLEPHAPLVPPRPHWPLVLLCCLTAIVAEQTLHLYGMRWGNSYVLGVLSQNSVPVFACLIGAGLGVERLTLLKGAGVAVALAGSIVMFLPFRTPAPPPFPPPSPTGVAPPPPGHAHYALGCICLLLASLAWAVSLFAQKPLLVAFRAPVTVTLWSVALGALISGLIAGVAAMAGSQGDASWAVSAEEGRFLAFAATLGCAVKYSIAAYINSHMEAVLNTVLDAVGHAAAVLVGAWVLQEPLHPRYAAALAVAAGGFMVSRTSEWGASAQSKPPATEATEPLLDGVEVEPDLAVK